MISGCRAAGASGRIFQGACGYADLPDRGDLGEKRPRVNPGKRHRKRAGLIFEPSLDLCLVSPSAVMVRRDCSSAWVFSMRAFRPARTTIYGCG